MEIEVEYNLQEWFWEVVELSGSLQRLIRIMNKKREEHGRALQRERGTQVQVSRSRILNESGWSGRNAGGRNVLSDLEPDIGPHYTLGLVSPLSNDETSLFHHASPNIQYP